MFVQKVFNHIPLKLPIAEIESETTDSGRRYLHEGTSLPSVTTVTGWEKRKFFAQWRKKNPRESVRVCSRGNKLHSVIEDYLNNKKIVLQDLPPNECDLFIQLKPELDRIDNIRALEVPLWSTKIGLAGRVDCIAEHANELAIIDFKGSTRSKDARQVDNYMMQATAYSLMWQDMTGEEINKFKILVSCESGEIQVFSDSPINWVKPLFKTIQNYKRENK